MLSNQISNIKINSLIMDQLVSASLTMHTAHTSHQKVYFSQRLLWLPFWNLNSNRKWNSLCIIILFRGDCSLISNLHPYISFIYNEHFTTTNIYLYSYLSEISQIMKLLQHSYAQILKLDKMFHIIASIRMNLSHNSVLTWKGCKDLYHLN